jgi:enamine deaminase RidA (YjgF/YER057c/UK114 family)
MNTTSRITSDNLAPPPEPYAHAVQAGALLFIAGQVAFDEHNAVVGLGDPHAQATQVWQNIRTVVEAAGGIVEDIVKITVFLADIRHAAAEVDVRRSMFPPGRYPSCTQVQVANLGLPELLMEVDAIAVISGSKP